MMKGSDLTGHSGNDEIGTPDALYEWLDRRFQFNYDAFASHANHLCTTYSTMDGTFEDWHSDGRHYITGEDGLEYGWQGARVFWNPPYSRPLFGLAVDKAIAERNNVEISAGLVKWDTSTESCRKLMQYAHVELLKRVQYKGMKAAATFASAIVIMRPDELWRPSRGKVSG